MRALQTAALVLLAGCTEIEEDRWQPVEREFQAFQQVLPTLLRDCAFHACHGSTDRAFHLWGPGRARLDPDTRAYRAITGDEVSIAFPLTRSMIDADDPEQSLLLRKPLAVSAGGDGHGGVDPYGRDVYRTTDDEGYRALRRFVLAIEDDPDAGM